MLQCALKRGNLPFIVPFFQFQNLMSQNPYEVLGVHPGADLDTIEAAYRQLSQALNPNGAPDDSVSQRLEEICWAYGFLTDSAKRARYDALTRHGPWAPPGQQRSAQKRASRPEIQPVENEQRVVLSICEHCGKIAPVQFSSLNQNIGFVVSHRHDWVEGNLCHDCIDYLFWRMTATTLLLGWWSLVSIFATPGYLLGNFTSFLEARDLQRGRGPAPSETGFWRSFTFLILVGIAFLAVVLFRTIFFS